MNRITLIASTASSSEPFVGITTKSDLVMAWATMTDAVPSRSTITNAALRAASSITSIRVSSVIPPITAKFSGFPGLRLQRSTGWFGSASMTMTDVPRCTSSVASSTADVDFPAPPLELANDMVGTAFPRWLIPLGDDVGLLTNSQQLADRLLSIDSWPTTYQQLTD